MIMFCATRRSLAVTLSLLVSPANAEGDPEYGQYLSSECVTCHQVRATDAKIPSIHGMDGKGFISIMKAYRARELDNPAMQTVAGRLTDEDIAALAAYYSALPGAEQANE